MIKGKIINFEWLCDHNHYTVEYFNQAKMKIIKRDIIHAAGQGYNLILGIYLIDGFLHCAEDTNLFLNEMQEIKKLADELKLKIILVSGQGETFSGLPFDSIFFDYTLRMSYNANSKYIDNVKFNKNDNRFLFLGGMPTRSNRIGLLSRLYDNNLLGFADWSFFSPLTEDDKKWCREYLTKYSDNKYHQFLKLCDRSFDNKYKEVLTYFSGYQDSGTETIWYDVVKTDFIKNPTFVDPAVFKNTSFSIISEGPNFWADDNFFGTEKTWRTIFYKHPFIFAGHPDQFRYLKKLGFKTFEEYVDIKDYAFIEDEEARLDAIVKNVEFLLTNMPNIYNKIEADVEFNFNLILNYITQQQTMLTKFKDEFNISLEEVSYFFNQTGYDHLIRNLPNDI
jgi:hypothetical protein